MRKSTRIVKRTLALFLVVLMSINTLGALVSDNDGSAFITKAEFDSLKSDFQNQIDQYNTSIDSKIDGAIASYLSGITVAKETVLNPQVSNYDEMWWIQQFLVKGINRHWTNRTTYTTDSTAIWQTWKADKRRNTRANQIQFSGCFGYWGPVTWLFDLRYQGNDDGWSYGHQLSQKDNESNLNYIDYCVPVTYIRLQDKDDDLYLNNGDTYRHLCYEVTIENLASWGFGYDGIETELNGASKALWEVEGSVFCVGNDPVNSFKVLTPDADDFCKFEVLTDTGNVRTAANRVKWTMPLKKKNVVATYPHQTWFLGETNTGWLNNIIKVWKEQSETGGGPYQIDYQNPALFTTGVNLFQMTSAHATATKKYVNRMMYGFDQATEDKEDRTNVYRLNNYVRHGIQTKQIETFSDFKSTTWKVNSLSVVPKPTQQPWTGDSSRILYPTNKMLTLQLPLLENVKIKQIRNTRFKYNKNTTSLRLGDGMPLVLDCPGRGTVEIEFKYTVNRIIDAVGSNKKITLDIKKANFFDTVNTNNADFYDGKVNGTSMKLKGAEVDASDGKVKIELEGVNKENNIWMRLAPKCNDGGYYVTISDLKMKLIED